MRTQREPRKRGHAQRFRIPCSTNNAPIGLPRFLPGLCAQKHEITCAWSSLHLVCQFGDMIAHRCNPVKHIVTFCARTAGIFGLFVLDSHGPSPYNF